MQGNRTNQLYYLSSNFHLSYYKIILMSSEHLPTVYKNTLGNYEIAIHMGNHRRKMHELGHKRERAHSTVSYKDLLDENPKRKHMLETKYTEI